MDLLIRKHIVMSEKRKVVLIVEDESSLMLVLHDRLQDEGFQVLKAEDGKEALALTLQEHPDLILLDLLMPVMDGVSMLKALREDAWGKTAHVIVLTNLGETEKREEVTALGVKDFLVKVDWKVEDVIQKIKETIG